MLVFLYQEKPKKAWGLKRGQKFQKSILGCSYEISFFNFPNETAPLLFLFFWGGFTWGSLWCLTVFCMCRHQSIANHLNGCSSLLGMI